MPDTWILTPAPASRIEDVRALHAESGLPAHHRVVVTTQPAPIQAGQVDASVLLFDSDEWNIGTWWNVGLDWIAEHADGDYEVLMAESDVRISADTVAALAWTMRDLGLAMVGADWHHVLHPGNVHVHQQATPVPYQWRPSGIALMAAGELGQRRDEQFRWWYSDDDADFQARVTGGVGVVGGTTLQHSGGTEMAGRLKAWADEDAAKFRAKWGCLPL